MAVQMNKPDQEMMNAIKQKAGKLVQHIAGYVAVRTMDIGLNFGLFEEIAEHPSGISSEDLSKKMKMDPLYTRVWCQSAYSFELLEVNSDTNYFLTPLIYKLLLDKDFPGYLGGMPGTFLQPEIFDNFAENLHSGQRTWWDKFSPTWIQMVSLTARPMYTRLIPNGFSQVPELADQLNKGARVLVLACGSGIGLFRMANHFPNSTFVGVDGDAYSLELIKKELKQNGLENKISLIQSMFEDIDNQEEFDLAVINASMHECRDLDKVTSNIYNSLKPGGYFVISDFPFPDSLEDYRTPPAQVMCGIQFFEAQIDDQLLPTRAFVELLNKHGFQKVGSFDMTPTHNVIFGQK